MTEPDRVLRPLQDAEPAIDSLDTYESPAVLQEALRATWHAVERTLRTLLRSDTTAPDDIRMTALSPAQMPTQIMLTELRRRDLISLELAGRVHELQQVVQRAEADEPHAADADIALHVVAMLRREVRSHAVGTPRVQREPAVASTDAGTAFTTSTASARERDAAPRRPLYVLAGVGAALVVVAVLVHLATRASAVELGITAFAADSAGVAERHFRAALVDDPDDVTARLYLARILRAQARTADAAEVLREAARAAPADAAVRRELGYLFLDLDVAPSAVEQFRQAVELDPADALNWVGLIAALRAAGDPSADAWLRRAPQEARTMIENARQEKE